MVETISVLRLTVPKIEEGAAPVDLDPGRVSQWLESLPLANVDESATSIRDSLQKMNRGRMPTEHRYRIMELISARSHSIDTAMKKQREKTAFQPSERNRRLAALHQSLLEEIAHGYKRILADLLQSGEPGRVPQAMVVASHRAIHAMSHVLLEAYVAYSLEPENTWGEIHRIYRFASQARFDKKVVDNAPGQPGSKTTIDFAYRQIILLFLANPYHLMQGEVYTLFAEITHWTDGCQLQPVQSGEALAGQLYIDPEQDKPPLYAPTNMPAKPLKALLIDVTEASAMVSNPIEALEVLRRDKKGLTLADRMKRDMLMRLKHAWDARRERTFPREPQNVEIDVVVSLGSCHHYLSGEKDFTPESDELRATGEAGQKSVDNLSIMSDHQEQWATNSGMQMSLRSSRFEASEVGGPDAWDTVFETRSQTVGKALDYEDKFRQKFAITTWKQHDISDGGISISLGNVEPAAGIRVGELIGYRHSASTDEPWSIGSVRWMQFLPGRGLSLGIRKLTDQAVAIGGRSVEGTGAGGEYFRLLLTGPLDDTGSTTLLAPAAIYDVGTLIMITGVGELKYLELTELADTSRSFTQFSVKVSNPPRTKTPLLKPSSTYSPF